MRQTDVDYLEAAKRSKDDKARRDAIKAHRRAKIDAGKARQVAQRMAQSSRV